jgi:hypothetical protein
MERIARNEEQTVARRRAADLAVKILSNEVDVLEAALEMHRLRWQANVDDRDTDFDAFTAVVSETDTLPIGRERENWAPEALTRKEPELVRARSWARSTVEVACANLIERFGNS